MGYKICDRNTPDPRQQPEQENGHLRFATISITLASQRTQELCAVSVKSLCLRPAGDGRTSRSPEILKSLAPLKEMRNVLVPLLFKVLAVLKVKMGHDEKTSRRESLESLRTRERAASRVVDHFRSRSVVEMPDVGSASPCSFSPLISRHALPQWQVGRFAVRGRALQEIK